MARFGAILALVVALAACGDDPVPGVRDLGATPRADALPGEDVSPSSLDSGVHADALVHPDATEALDTGGHPDADPPPDSGPGDSGVHPDAAAPDASAPDAMAADRGPRFSDFDSDTISDSEEDWDIAIDVDSDGTPDYQDLDSDNDGIPDAVEAGDADLATPPVDTDRDGAPDFRDHDSDGDGILDGLEGLADPDNDGIPAYRDLDADGDGLPDRVEGGGDADSDGRINNLDLDADGDGIPDGVEGAGDLDMDGTPNFLDLDSDGDGIPDADEGMGDLDTDGIPDFLDPDTDGDGIPDAVEGRGDPDVDAVPSYRDLDADGDTIRDDHEGVADRDGDGTPNYLDLDADGDTVPDANEAGDASLATPPRDTDFDGAPDFLDGDSDNDNIADRDEGLADTDSDGIPDRYDIDSDNDGILDDIESGDTSTTTPPIDTDSDLSSDFRDLDSDGDTVLDITEGTNDADRDGVANFRDLDADGDGWWDAVEAGDTDPNTPPVDTDRDNIPDYLDVDADGDGLADATEPGCPMGPDRLRADSDSDTYPDPAELAFGSDPCSSSSIIDDFYFFLPPGGPGANAPLRFTETAIDRADMAINVDTTGSMQGEIDQLRLSLSNTIIPGVNAAIPDVATAVSSFEDYPISPFGNAAEGDVPFRLGTRVTTNRTVAQAAVNALRTRDGLDLPESGIEALHQIATGAGTSWPGGSVPAFNPALNRVPQVADGTIGGVGFRDDALPIVVHVTDAPSHERADYSAGINAADTSVVAAALAQIGARVVTVSNTRIAAIGPDPFTPICDRTDTRVFGNIRYPFGTDTDYFVLQGVAAGASVSVETFAIRLGSGVDTMVAIMNASATIAANDDLAAGVLDSRVTASLSGAGPYYVAVTAYNDGDFNGSGATSAGFFFADIRVNGQPFVPSPVGCRADDANGRGNATPLVSAASAALPPNTAACVSACQAILSPYSMPYGLSVATEATVPPCAWGAFGGSRPPGCAANQCCTGLGGAGVAPSAPGGLCPLAFQIADNGTGIDAAVVTGIRALVSFSTFTITTVVRPDPAELQASGLDTSCFIHGVIPTQATPPNACAPQPIAVDLLPPSPELDSWQRVVPGTVLEFDVRALNVNRATTNPCAPSIRQPQLFRAFIDVVADGVTVVDTRQVIIIVPPLPPTGGS